MACSELSMAFFDRLFGGPIARENGRINKCFDEYYEDITISDELRKVGASIKYNFSICLYFALLGIFNYCCLN